MRLVEVELENFKQYSGVHRLEPGENAIVAVVGHNGAGKTTLFEAIEWCLYNPSRIRNDSLIPRQHGGKPRVRVVLEDPGTGIVYEVERSLKGSSTQAEIYRQDQPESPIVQGTRQVTEYVSRELIGLSHTAFVSTFFTRQKELSFFGDMGATQRREQVGRLLGLETIRVAQKQIGERRTRKQAEARVKREQFEEQSQGIDFDAERSRLDAEIVAQQAARDGARIEESQCRASTATATAARETAQRRFAEHARLMHRRQRIDGDRLRLEEQRDRAERDLEAIAHAEREIETHRHLAADEPALREAIAGHDREQRKADEERRLRTERERLITERPAVERALTMELARRSTGDAGSRSRAQSLASVLDQELARIAAIDLDRLDQQHKQAERLAELQRTIQKDTASLDSLIAHAAKLEAEREALLVGGTPAERLHLLQVERGRLQEEAAALTSDADQTARRARQLHALAEQLRTSDLGERCPTCARPFREGEAAETIEALAEQIRILEAEVASKRATASERSNEADELRSRESVLLKEIEQLHELLGRLERGAEMIRDRQQTLREIEDAFRQALQAAGRTSVPSDGEITRLAAAYSEAAAICAQRADLEVARDRILRSLAEEARIDADIAALGTIAYDPEAHRRDYAAWEQARDAAARIEELSRRVAERPERESAREQSRIGLEELDREQCAVDREIAALAYDPSELDEANRVEAEALDRERAATEAAHAAEQRLRDAKRSRQDLDALEARLQTLNDEARSAEVEATLLQRAYGEFARFEQFVALRVTPALGQIASELLEKATDGKYDRLEFTEDYGIEIYDGEYDRFPLAQFSGGERDIIALCARLALSQVIGGKATTPIEFMVLDEVFGSLDLDRRRNLMDMLQRLVEESRAFRQLFVISHVDDVRAASMFDEVWRVSESVDGISQLEQVSVTGALEDY